MAGPLQRYNEGVFILKQWTCFYYEFLWLFLEDKLMDINFAWCLHKKQKKKIILAFTKELLVVVVQEILRFFFFSCFFISLLMDGFSHLLIMIEQKNNEPIGSISFFSWHLKRMEEIAYSPPSDHTATYHLILLVKPAQENFAEEASFAIHKMQHVCKVSFFHTVILKLSAYWLRNLPLTHPITMFAMAHQALIL